MVILLGGCGSDYHSKQWAQDNIKNGSAVIIITNVIDLGFTANRGMIFGLFNNTMPRLSKILLVIFRLILLLALTAFIWILRDRPLLFLLPFMFFWIGAIGNLIDHFKYGYVVDFIHIRAGTLLNWPFYFNLADAFITVGLFLILTKEIVRVYRSMRL